MTPKTKTPCPRCGGLMNRHAVKMIQSSRGTDDLPGDPILGGIVEAVHACATCGTNWSESMRSTMKN